MRGQKSRGQKRDGVRAGEARGEQACEGQGQARGGQKVGKVR
jgi:hypothetical protein